MAVEQKLLTVEEFWEQYAGQPFELINGEVIPLSPAGYDHAAVERRIGNYLGDYVDEHELGDVINGEAGFWLDPRTMRGADVAYISNEKLDQVTDSSKYLPFSPDIAVEVVSPFDTASEIREKVKKYITAGSRLVWVAYPATREIVVHYPDGTAKTISEQDTLTGEDVLPGFSVPAKNLFPRKRGSNPKDSSNS